MRTLLGGLAVLAVAWIPLDAGPIDSGKWEVVKVERDGKADPSLTGAVRTHDGNKYVLTPKSGEPVKGTFKTDDTTTPKSIDNMPESGRYKGKVLRGIYKIDGDTLTICFAANPDLPRPTEFVSKPGYVLAVHRALK